MREDVYVFIYRGIEKLWGIMFFYYILVIFIDKRFEKQLYMKKYNFRKVGKEKVLGKNFEMY